ncbi:hypothetical protein GLYMA_19G016900v4 [Glycine max]|uniref:Uncharacterized protein n=1 Tax=Glycine max TaxID=3847 RepID=K7MVZ5_SOYBN|nr:hypothetical protein JHK86_052006 [Glycine max]KAG4914531.1 hypothetical protein JHK87_052088 [Glycine soja]KAG4926379.1 hypothetical protein JHK85_052865 [Glycine max]KAH1075978.1 hypothetical protein GYH30_051735 [Glycine max]KRG93447.1 hypothetical protein GLYMA_19G016900v4 [Glycine max]
MVFFFLCQKTRNQVGKKPHFQHLEGAINDLHPKGKEKLDIGLTRFHHLFDY